MKRIDRIVLLTSHDRQASSARHADVTLIDRTAARYGLTTFCGLPFTNATRLSTARFINLARASLAAQAICGVTRQFFAASSGLLAAGGSTDSTSTPAPAITPEFSASAKS